MGKQISFIMSSAEIMEFLTNIQERNAYCIDEYVQELSLTDIATDTLFQFFIGYPSSQYQTVLDDLSGVQKFFHKADYQQHQLQNRTGKDTGCCHRQDMDLRMSTFSSDVIEITLGGWTRLNGNAVTYIPSRAYISSTAPEWLQKEYKYLANLIRKAAYLRHRDTPQSIVYVSHDIALDIKQHGSIIA